MAVDRSSVPGGAVALPGPFEPNAHLRWHPLRGEWIAHATHRQHRTFCRLGHNRCAYDRSVAAHRVPEGEYDAAVFENLFPSFTGLAHDPPLLTVDTRPARGVCEVMVFTRDPLASLGSLPLAQIELLFEVWADRYRELGSRDDVEYVFEFEHRGVEVGVTLHHPHGQIYAYPFVPPVPARELENQKAYLNAHGRGSSESVIEAEIAGGTRVLYAGPEAIAFVPVFARYPYGCG
jgi:UDPglucose--hexose-1-phosphate uridylyltransferase